MRRKYDAFKFHYSPNCEQEYVRIVWIVLYKPGLYTVHLAAATQFDET